MTETAANIFRDYNTAGVPASGEYQPEKALMRRWGAQLEAIISTGALSGAVWKTTKALLDADLAHAAGTVGVVYEDATSANNGFYVKSGASGAGSWSQEFAFLPGYQFVHAADAGAGTANAIQATTLLPVPGDAYAALILMNVFEANTGAVTVALNGGTAKALKTNSGNDLASGYLAAGMLVAFVDDGTNYRLLSDVASLSIQAAAEAAQAAAEAAASAIVSELDSVAYAEASYSPAAAPNKIRVSGYASAGDGGGGLYKKVASEPAHEGKFSITLADAVTVVWYELAPENPGEVSVLQFGANGDGVTDDLFAFDDARDFLIDQFGGGTIRVPHTADGYALSDTFINDAGPIRLLGETNAVQPGMGTMILVAATKTGINFKNGSLGRGAFSTVENIRLVGSDTMAGSNDGLLMQANSGRIINVTAESFGGYGVHILSSTGSPDVSINVNHWYAEKVRCYQNFTGGWAVEGVDSNAGTGVALDCADNEGWQFYENSLIGNTYIGPHSACPAGGVGDWLLGDINRFVRIIGGYSEDSPGKIGIRIEAGGAGGHYLDFGNLNNTIEDLSGTTSTVINWSAGGMSYNRLRVGTATEVRGVWNENGIQLSDGAFYYGTRNSNAAAVMNRSGSDGVVAVWQKAGATVGSVSVTAAATTYNTSSDHRLKDGIRDLMGSGAFIDALRPRQWKWKIDGTPGAGFIAHEAQEVTPSSVTGEKDAVDENGEPIFQAMMPGSSEIIANLVAEVQDLRRRLARLESS